VAAGIGWYGTFKFGSTDHINGAFPFQLPPLPHLSMHK
jgi:hypothetical protein